MATTRDDVLSWRGQTLNGSDGGKIGSIEEIYLDSESGEPEWALVSTGLFGSKQTFVPISDATTSGDAVSVPYDKATVKDAPNIDPDGSLSRDEEAELYRHYGRDYGGSATGGAGLSGTGDEVVETRGVSETRDLTDADLDTDGGERGGPGRDVSGPNTDSAMTLSEEELRVGTRERESGRVRLKKYVVEDTVTETVPVRREEVRLEREPITDVNRDEAYEGPDISEEEHEVVLHAEEPVVEKQAVAKERVRLETDVQTEQREVSDTVRSERVDVDDSRGDGVDVDADRR